jgi:hypothetical protein
MPTRAEVYQAILNADKAGDSDSVRALGAYLKTMPAAAPASDAIDQGARNFAQDMPGQMKFLAGAGKAMTDIGRGVGQRFGMVDQASIDEAKRMDAPLMRTGAGVAGNITGNVAAMLPAALIPGVGSIAGGAALGAGIGALQPTASDDSGTVFGADVGPVARNALIGGALGSGAVVVGRALGSGYRAAKAAAEPFTQAGQDAILGRALVKAAGKDAPAVSARLQDATAPAVGPFPEGQVKGVMGELVPGSVPTVGQAAQNPGVAALERAATATNPVVTNDVTAAFKAQNAARQGALEDMAGTGWKRDFFAADRESVANQLYGEARRLGVDPAKLTPEALQNIASFSKRVPDEVLGRARQLAQISGEPMTDATSVQGMHWVKMAIDDLIGSADRAGNTTLKRAYTGLQKDLLTGLDNLSPSYKNARQTFAEMSKPINEMDTVAAIAKKSTNPLTGDLYPQKFARALSDDTAAAATGFPGANLENTVSNQSGNRLQAILEDLRRSNAAQNVGRGPGSDTVQKLAYTNMLDQAGVPTMLRAFKPAELLGNIAARGGDAAYAKANQELSNRLAQLMLNPSEAATLMQGAIPQGGPTHANALLNLLAQARRNVSPSLGNAQRRP